MHRIIRVYSLLAVLLDPIVHVFLENTVYGVYTVHRIIRVYSMLSKEKGPYGATMVQPCDSLERRPCDTAKDLIILIMIILMSDH